ncbi:MAG: hypothetical protein OXG98_00445 [Gemmatimonadetes bacterium]|nr:hypothetical protein [Gemmatimonadota bacterium]
MPALADRIQPLFEVHPRLSAELRNLCGEVDREIYVVGGSVRDAILGRRVRDLDLTLAEDGLRLGRMLADRLRCPFVPLDDADRTGRIMLRPRYTIDISSFKGDTLLEDLGRRDFTVNAMAVRLADVLEGRPSIIDPLNGANDLASRRLQALSGQSFRDDPLRILRAYRLAGQFGLDITPETASWSTACSGGLRDVSGERLLYELALILGARNAADRVSAMIGAGVFGVLFAGWTGPATAELDRRLERTDRLMARDAYLADHGLYSHLSGSDTKLAGDRSGHWILRFASLVLFFLPANGAGPALDHIERTADRLKLSNRERRALHQLVFGSKRLLEGIASRKTSDEALCRIVRGTKDETPGAALLALAHGTDEASAAAGSVGPVVDRLLQLYSRHRTVRSRGLLLDGADIMEDRDIPEGPEIGRMLDRLENIQILHDIRTREEARNLLYDDHAISVDNP